MNIAGLSHFNITAPRELLERVRDFYVEVLGLAVGERPNFMREGFWLYAGPEPIVHLTACGADDPRAGGGHGPSFFDHVAFNCSGLPSALERLRRSGVPYELAEVPSMGQVQIFLRDPAGVGVELNFVGERPA
ncbi:MAG: VOC family protein [Acidobacteria bacterium]|nr:VOC family protein [Acidobacteriota bacterium]